MLAQMQLVPLFARLRVTPVARETLDSKMFPGGKPRFAHNLKSMEGLDASLATAASR